MEDKKNYQSDEKLNNEAASENQEIDLSDGVNELEASTISEEDDGSSRESVADDLATRFSVGEESENDTSVEIDTLSAILYDDYDDNSVITAEENQEELDAFIRDYRELIANAMKNESKAAEEKNTVTDDEFFKMRVEFDSESNISSVTDENEAVDFSTLKKHSRKGRSDSEGGDDSWSDEITLSPAEYEELLPENDSDSESDEDERIDEDYQLGNISGDDDFQISIDFEGNANNDEPEADNDEKDYKYDPEKPRIIDNIFDFVELFVFTLVAVMLITTFGFRRAVVDGPSMQNTLEHGDQLIITDLFYTPKRGDIIVFEDYSTTLDKAVVKRVIGLPGDEVEVKLIDNKDGKTYYEVYVNGELLEEDYAYNDPAFSFPEEAKCTVPEGELFVMGDNRFNSTDSRSDNVKTIDIDSVLGKVILRIYPFNKFGTIN